MADRGVEELASLGRSLRELGDKEFRRETMKALHRAAKPGAEAALREGAGTLPHGGGLSDYVAGTKVTVRAVLGGQNPRVQIKGKPGRTKSGPGADLDRMDRTGQVRHPLFGNRAHWYTTQVRPGWWTDAMTRNADLMRVPLMEALHAALKAAAKR